MEEVICLRILEIYTASLIEGGKNDCEVALKEIPLEDHRRAVSSSVALRSPALLAHKLPSEQTNRMISRFLRQAE